MPIHFEPPRPQPTAAVTLGEIAAIAGAAVAGASFSGAQLAVPITGFTANSGYVRPGDLFAALPGTRTHGAAHTDDAVRSGAVAVLTDAAGAAVIAARHPDLPVLIGDDVRARLGAVADVVYGKPSARLPILAITGTSGKTTTAYFVHAALSAAGLQPGLIGTVATIVGTDVLDSGFTTPEAPELQALFAAMIERGSRACVMEVSSHALAMGRVVATTFEAGGFTNLSPEHLDFHESMEEYFHTKASLFGQVHGAKVVDIDTQWGRRLAERIGASAITVSADGDPQATWRASGIVADGAGSLFTVERAGSTYVARCAVPGRHNVSNVLLALALVDAVGVGPQLAIEAISTAVVPGRMEPVDVGQDFTVLVDYSHKPAAVEAAVGAAREIAEEHSGRVILVLGCGGDRDAVKRPSMGKVGAQLADLLIVTDDNPRSEDPATIRASIVAGARSVVERGEIEEIGDRALAIRRAVAAADSGDVVLIAGKGHERGQYLADRVIDFDDRVQAREALINR